EGQMQGGIAHGIGNALYEWMGYDDAAQPVTTTFADYLLPTDMEVPRMTAIFKETPSPLNPLGAKGAGEVSTIPTAAAIVNAIEGGLTTFGVRISQTPVTPAKIVELIAEKNGGGRLQGGPKCRTHAALQQAFSRDST